MLTVKVSYNSIERAASMFWSVPVLARNMIEIMPGQWCSDDDNDIRTRTDSELEAVVEFNMQLRNISKSEYEISISQ